MSVSLILSLGSNIEPKKDYLIQAINELNKYFKLKKVSSLYLTEPLEDTDQDDFINLCVNYNCDIEDPYKVLKIINNIENKIGRKRDYSRLKGPRVIDIDIIFFGEYEISNEELTIPHKSLFYRKFVLKPLVEILSEDSNYITKYKLESYLNKLKNQNVKKIGELAI